MKKILAMLFIFACAVRVSAAQASVSSIMMDAESGEVIYENNADERRYPASLTKLMTLYITFNALENKHIKLTDQLKVSKTAAGRSPSKLGVRAGETISVKDAIMAVIVKSANDCATVLAEHFASSEAEFAVLMTKTAAKLGMKDTVFKNASGLPNSQQKTTARDMATLGMAVYHHFPQYYKWFSAQSFVYKGQTINGHNHVLKTFAGADGMKTGYTAAAGFNIVTSATRNNKRVIAVTMGHKYVNERDKRVSVLMDKGLNYMNKTGATTLATLKDELNGKTPTKYASNNAVSGKKTATLTAKAEAKSVETQPKAVAKATPAKQTTPEKQIADNSVAKVTNGKYAVQVGSFSDYNRAKVYATNVKNKIAKQYAVHNIKVEKVNTNGNILYRSKVVGLAKKDATKICQNMKKSKQSCIVVADSGNMKLAQK